MAKNFSKLSKGTRKTRGTRILPEAPKLQPPVLMYQNKKERMTHVKTRIRALLLALVLVLSMTTAAFAADAGSGSACLTVSTVLRDSKIEATVYLQARKG